jgi:predicted RNA-binding protein with PIN domain
MIDAMNVIGARPTGWWRDRPAAVRRLVETARRFAAATGDPVTLVIDGRPLPDLPEGMHDGVGVLYARRPGANAADDRIVELLESGHAPAPVHVVTSDRALRARIEALGAEVHGARRWLAEAERAADMRAWDGGGLRRRP